MGKRGAHDLDGTYGPEGDRTTGGDDTERCKRLNERSRVGSAKRIPDLFLHEQIKPSIS